VLLDGSIDDDEASGAVLLDEKRGPLEELRDPVLLDDEAMADDDCKVDEITGGRPVDELDELGQVFAPGTTVTQTFIVYP